MRNGKKFRSHTVLITFSFFVHRGVDYAAKFRGNARASQSRLMMHFQADFRLHDQFTIDIVSGQFDEHESRRGM